MGQYNNLKFLVILGKSATKASRKLREVYNDECFKFLSDTKDSKKVEKILRYVFRIQT